MMRKSEKIYEERVLNAVNGRNEEGKQPGGAWCVYQL